MEKKPAIVAHRLTELREGIHVSQARLAAVFDLDQPAIFRYENAQSFPPYGVLMISGGQGQRNRYAGQHEQKVGVPALSRRGHRGAITNSKGQACSEKVVQRLAG